MMNTMKMACGPVCVFEDASLFSDCRRTISLLTAALIFPIATANAQVCWPETQQLEATVGTGYMWRSSSISISGDVMVVGLADEDGPSMLGGDVFVYHMDTQSSQWTQVQHLQDTANGTVADFFGWSVCVWGDTLAIGEPGNTPLNTGRVFVYERDPQSGAWSETQQVTPSSPVPDDNFGAAVSLFGDVMVVGAVDPNNASNAGRAFIFERDGSGIWQEVQELNDPTGAVGFYYGYSVSVSGDVIVVGAYGDDDQGAGSGSVFVYEPDGQGTWQQTQKLLQPGGGAGTFFGGSVSICNDVIAIGAPRDAAQGTNSGNAFVFERDTQGVWQPAVLALPTSLGAEDILGVSVSVNVDTLVITAPRNPFFPPLDGSAFVYQRDSTTGEWLELEELLPADGAPDSWFGFAADISDGTIGITAAYDNVAGIGRTYVYTLEPNCKTPSPEICDNGIDDDCDGFIDCDDPDCTGNSTFNGFVDSGQTLGSEWSTHVALGDVDDDGDLDAWVANFDQANHVWINQGGIQGGNAGTFSDSGQGANFFGFSKGVALGDVDDDGDLDAWVANYDANRVWINQGGIQGGNAGTFSDSGQALGIALSDGVDLGDLDGDGDLDAFVANAGAPNKVWINQGGDQSGTPGQFLDSGQQLGNSSATDIALGDVDGDGDLDAFVANGGTAFVDANKVWINTGGAQGGTAGVFTDSGLAFPNNKSTGVTLGDLDNDGDLDAYVANYNEPNRVYVNQGGTQGGTPGFFVDSGQALGNFRSRKLALGDVDADGDLDAFVACSWQLAGQPNRVWINDGGQQGGTAGIFTDSGQTLGYRESRAVALGDLNSDGSLDAFVANARAADNPDKVWFNESTDPCSGMIGDFNGDRCVNGTDLAMLLGQWGVPNPPTGDIDRDNDVDGQDLALLLGNWLACPG